jgi:hypothetical protein
VKQLFAICGMAAALICGAGVASAQDNGGGGGGGGFGRGGGGGMDPAEFQQRMMDRIRTQLEFTNDTDWSAVQPLVQKVFDAQRDVRANQMAGMRMGFRNRGGQNGGGQNDDQRRQRFGGFFGQPSPEFTALQDAVNNNAPDGQVKDLLARYNASQKAKQDKLKAAQDNLRAVLSVRQEASATLIGLLN